MKNYIAQINFSELEGATLKSDFAGKSIGTIVGAIIPYTFFFAGSALLLYIIYGGFKLMTSSGDPAKISQGKSILTNGLVGFFIVFFSFWIVQLIGLFLGLDPVIDAFK